MSMENTQAILDLQAKVRKEAQEAVTAIYEKYNDQMISLLSKTIPEGHTMHSANGVVLITNPEGEEVERFKAWGIEDPDEITTKIALLQYSDEIEGHFSIPMEIKS